MPKIPLVGVAGEGFSDKANARRCVNLAPHIDDAGGKEKLVWLPSPGTKAFGTPTAALRGAPVEMGGDIYYVAGASMYSINSSGVESTALGTLDTSSGNVSLVANRNQVAAVDGDATNRKIYVYDEDDGFHTILGFSTEITITGIAQNAAVNISSIVHAGNIATVTTATNHGIKTDDYTTLAGTASHNGIKGPCTRISGTEFSYDHGSNPGDEGAVGTSEAHRFTVTSNSHGGTNGDQIKITSTDNFNFTHTLNDSAANTFTVGGADYAAAAPADETGISVTGYLRKAADAFTIQMQFLGYMDSYGIVNNARNNAADGVTDHEFYVSVGDDLSSWIVTHALSAERTPDALVRPFPFFGELYLPGKDSMEVWYNDGSASPSFAPARNAALQWGCTSGWTMAALGNTFCFLGEKDGQPTVLMMSGYEAVDVANQRIQNVIRQQTRATLEAATAFSLRTMGHEFYCLQFDSSSTYVYDYAMSRKLGFPVWWEWQSYGEVAFVGKWYVYAFGKHLIADSTAAYLYEIDWDTVTERDEGNDRAIKRIGTSGYIHADHKGVIHNRFFLDMATPSTGGDVTLEYTDDAGDTWVDAGSRRWSGPGDLIDWFADDLGGFTRIDRVYRITIDQALAAKAVIGGYIDIAVCEF